MNPNTERDIKKSKTRHTVDSLFVEDVRRELIAYSFYLPIDMMTDPSYEIQPIKHMSNADFRLWAYSMTGSNSVKFDGAEILVTNARTVAVSTRTSRHGTFHVCKVWYGNGVMV